MGFDAIHAVGKALHLQKHSSSQTRSKFVSSPVYLRGFVMPHYDLTGVTYSHTRRADPRIAAAINYALAGARSVANVGAGAGSYEPAQTIVAIEPSQVMIRQRPPSAARAVQAAAEALPLRTGAVDATLAVLTVHHWADLAAGVAEMRRVASRRVIILTWDHEIIRDFWLLRDYVPAAAETDARLAVPIDDLVSLVGPESCGGDADPSAT